MTSGKPFTRGLGLFLVIAGNLMGKLTRNFFVGIRTPWTLASDEVWLRTHRLGGKILVLAGIVVFVLGLLGVRAPWKLVVILVAVSIPVAYSYVIYRRIEGFKNGTPDEHSPHA